MGKSLKSCVIKFVYLILGLICLVGRTFSSICYLKSRKSGVFCLALFFQPTLLAITGLFFYQQIENVLTGFIHGNGNLLVAVALVALILFVLLYLNSVTHFLFLFIKREENYRKFIGYQKSLHNYMLLFISMLAIYVAIVHVNANEFNILLLMFCILFILSMIILELYERLFINNKITEKTYEQIKSHLDNTLNNLK